MKRRSLVSIILVLTLVMTLLCSVVVTASAAEGGEIQIDNSSVTSTDENGYYYVNEAFEFVPDDEEDSFFYVQFDSADEFVDAEGELLSGEELYAMGTKVENTQVTVVEDAGTELYYLFATVDSEGAVSDATVVCVDTKAPVFVDDGLALVTWLETSEDAIVVSDDDSEVYFSLNNAFVSAGDAFVMPSSWAELVTILTEDTAVVTDDEGDASNNLEMLTITLEYCAPSDYYDDAEWSSVDIDDDFDLDELGVWVFRFVVTDMAGNSTTSDAFERTVRSIGDPSITLSTTDLAATSDGITAGVQYTIPTPAATDCLGVTLVTYYTVYKLVDGEYVEIFDSETEVVTEGYEDYITVGYLTPGADEESQIVNASYEYLYTIVYRVTDANGLTAEETLEVRINATTELTGLASLTTWEWVLIAVSVASAVGIVCLLVIKPKKNDTQTNTIK